MVTFTHDQQTTPEADWLASPRIATMADLAIDWDTVKKMIVVAAHPDDETLGAAGLLQRATTHGVSVEVLVATMGEQSHPRSTTHTPEQLSALRTIELQKALAVLTPTVNCHTLGLPDGKVSEHTRDLEHEIASAAAPGGPATLILAPWSADGHTDHDAAGAAATNAAALTGSLLLEYPIWMWHWGSPTHSNIPWPALRKFGLTPKEHAAKATAMSSHTSQIAPLSDNAGDETLLSPGLLAHFGRSFETFIDTAGHFTPSGSGSRAWLGSQFDAVHAGGAEPWDPQSWYETRKRSLLLAALPSTRYQSTLELGCSTGTLTAELSHRSRQITGVDASVEAVASAKLRLATVDNARILHSTLPQDWPPGRFDLFVLSETGYYFSTQELSEMVGKMAACALPDAHLVACHWRHPIAGWPLGGDDVHGILRNDARLTVVAAYMEDDFLLETFRFRDAP